MKIIKGKVSAPRSVLIYGTNGCGKTTWATSAPNAILVDFEGGSSDIDCHRTGQITEWGEVVNTLMELGELDYKWVILDSLDWLERIIWGQVASSHGKDDVSAIPYGQGYKEALGLWSYLLRGLELLKTKGIGTIAICHSQITRFESPEGQSYDRYEPKLYKSASALWREWVDEILFASYKSMVVTEDGKFGQKRSIGVGTGERYLRTTETPAVVAKNRLQLPTELPMSWEAYQEFFTGE